MGLSEFDLALGDQGDVLAYGRAHHVGLPHELTLDEGYLALSKPCSGIWGSSWGA